MKQAILITAYKDFQHLLKLIDYFDSDFNIYIHIDKKVEVPKKTILELNSRNIVKFLSQKFRTNWGGFNHLKAMLLLSQKALENENNQYLHLISGQDFPIKPMINFKNFYKDHQCSNFLNYFNLPFYKWSSEGGYDRLYYYRFYDLMNYKIEKQRYRIKRIVNIQKKLNFKRSFPADFPKLYGGSTWWSLNREAVEYVVEYSQKNKKIFSRFKYTFCPEEFYFPTLLLNSNLKDTIVNDNRRFIVWKFQNGSNPAILDESNLKSILSSDAFFARKLNEKESINLVNKLKELTNE